MDDAAMEKTGGEKVPKSFVIRRCTLFRCRRPLPVIEMWGHALKWQNLRGGWNQGRVRGIR